MSYKEKVEALKSKVAEHKGDYPWKLDRNEWKMCGTNRCKHWSHGEQCNQPSYTGGLCFYHVKRKNGRIEEPS